MSLVITIITIPRAVWIHVPTQVMLNNYLHILSEKTVISLFQQFNNFYNINPLIFMYFTNEEALP